MKTSLTTLLALQRPNTPQAVLRLFAAGAGEKIPESLRYLARPHYRTLDGRTVTLAGDGRVFLWARARVPGFADYEIPPGGMGYVDVPGILALKRGFPQADLPSPAGPWTGNATDEIWLGQHTARIKRFDLMRLGLLDFVKLGAGEAYRSLGFVTGWKTVGLWWKCGNVSGEGVILCAAPKEIRSRK